jgi:hypothetical protein
MKARIQQARQNLTWNLFIFLGWQISVWVPKEHWYRTTLSIVRLMNRTVGVFAPKQLNVSSASAESRLFHRLLDQLASHDTFFPIPLVVEGEEHLRNYCDQPGGFVVATAHIPFLKMIMPVIRRVSEGKREFRVVARHPEGEDKNLLYGWNDDPWLCLRADQSMLIHTRSLLRNNGILVVAIDKDQGDVISGNIFRFVGKMNSRVLTSFTELQPDGSILLRILMPPSPLCKSDREITDNLGFVAGNVARILQGKKAAMVAKPVFAEDHESDSDQARELHRIRLYSTGQLQSRMNSLEKVLQGHAEAAGQRSLLQDRLEVLRSEFQNRVGA